MNFKKPQSRAYQPHTTCPQSDVLLCAAAHCPREVPAHMICPEDSHRTPPCRPRPSMLKLCWIHKIAFCFVYLRFSFGTFAQNPSLMFVGFFRRSPLRGVWIEIMVRLASWGTCAVAPLAGSVDRNTTVYTDYANYNRSLPSRGAWIEMGNSCPGRSFWPLRAPSRLSRGAVLPGCPDGRAVPQPVGQGFPAASKAPAPKIWPNAAFCRPAACHFWEEAPDSGTGPAAERDAAAGCRHPKPTENLSSAPSSSRARRKSI